VFKQKLGGEKNQNVTFQINYTLQKSYYYILLTYAWARGIQKYMLMF